MKEEEELTGFCYKDGTPISRHPSEKEINAHIDEYAELIGMEADREQLEILDQLRDVKITKEFKAQVLNNHMNDEQILAHAIKVWSEQYPWEIPIFFRQIDCIRANLNNEKAYSEDKSVVLYGMIPERVKSLCLNVRREFFHRDSKGKSKNIENFYKLCPRAKISSLRGSA